MAAGSGVGEGEEVGVGEGSELGEGEGVGVAEGVEEGEKGAEGDAETFKEAIENYYLAYNINPNLVNLSTNF